jgi:hypothetical protein
VSGQRRTRRPTGKPPWPIILLAGVEKAGKSYAAAAASGSELVGGTFWIGVGEDDPDEYGKVPGADFEIVEHDGTFRDILAAAEWASAQPKADGRPNLLVVDSHGRVWDLLSNMAQAEANARRRGSNGDAKIAPDLWNLAGDRWERLLDVLRRHDGPVIVTARLERQTVFTEDGNPTKDRHNKVKAQKGLPFDVGVVVELHAVGEAYITGARSLALNIDPATKLPAFTVDALWRRMGLAEPDATTERRHAGIVVADGEPDTADKARADLRELAEARGWPLGEVVTFYAAQYPDAPPLPQDTDAARIREFATRMRDAKRTTTDPADRTAPATATQPASTTEGATTE